MTETNRRGVAVADILDAHKAIIEAHTEALEALNARDNERHAETQAMKTAVAWLVAALHSTGAIDARQYMQLPFFVADQSAPAVAKLKELVDLIDLCLKSIPAERQQKTPPVQ